MPISRTILDEDDERIIVLEEPPLDVLGLEALGVRVICNSVRED